MKRAVRSFAAAALGAALGMAPAAQPAEPRTVRVAVLAFQGAEASSADWSGLAQYLNRTVPGYRFELSHLDLDPLRATVARGGAEFVLTNSGHYVVMEAEFGLSRIATVSRSSFGSPDRALGSAIIARAERADLQDFRALAGKTIAAVAPDAFGGYLVGLRELAKAGVDLERGDARPLFVGLPMQRIVQEVALGKADAGIVRACLLESLVEKNVVRAADFKVIGTSAQPGFPCRLSTPLYPDWPIAKSRHTDLMLAKAVATSLLSMPETGDGLSWAVPADYQTVHELYRELRTGPYASLRESTLEAMARRYWAYLLALVLGMAAFVVHAVRVEHLVKQRTRELSEALAARHSAEARMRSQQEQAEHLARLSILGELAGTLAHELNQPLTAIGTYAQSLHRRIAAQRLDAKALAQASSEIAAQAERAGSIIRGIRAFARKRAAVREERDPCELVREAVGLFCDMMPGVPSVVVDNAAAGVRVHADALQVQQVVLNLLKNAADATEGAGAEDRVIRVALLREGPWLRVSVADRGTGMTEELRTRLFEPFFTTKENGLGLGLSISKSIVEAHGGRLSAQAGAHGRGSCFSFTLPVHASA